MSCKGLYYFLILLQEYGITVEEKLNISQIICKYLIKKLRADLSHTYDTGSDFIHRLDPKYIHSLN